MAEEAGKAVREGRPAGWVAGRVGWRAGWGGEQGGVAGRVGWLAWSGGWPSLAGSCGWQDGEAVLNILV